MMSLNRGVSKSVVAQSSGPLITDWTDVLFIGAIVTLPIDGTRLGIDMPYWTPIAPALLVLYAVCNPKLLARSVRWFMPFYILFVTLMATSVYGWLTIGFSPLHTAQTICGLIGGLGCLASIDIAVRLKKLNWNKAITVLVAAYCFAFAIGVLQWLDRNNGLPWLTTLSQRLMYRNYVPRKPQFLFAEPSYIGMHLFGVLLPLFWITRRKVLAAVALGFAIGSAAMGVGVRILIDTVIALLLWCVVFANWKCKQTLIPAVLGFVGVGAGGAVVLATNDRVHALLTQGILTGDFSMLARIFRSLTPIVAGLRDPLHLLLGFGAGNIKLAMLRGYEESRSLLDAWGANTEGNGEIRLIGNTTNEDYYFTMNAYISFVTEFGLIMLIASAAVLLWFITRHHSWNKLTVCWLLLLLYLYIQFEGYAFYAVWLFIWAVGVGLVRRNRKHGKHDSTSHGQALCDQAPVNQPVMPPVIAR